MWIVTATYRQNDRSITSIEHGFNDFFIERAENSTSADQYGWFDPLDYFQKTRLALRPLPNFSFIFVRPDEPLVNPVAYFVRDAFFQKPMLVDQKNHLVGFVLRDAIEDGRISYLASDPESSGPCAETDDPLLRETGFGDSKRCLDCSQLFGNGRTMISAQYPPNITRRPTYRHGPGPLYIIIKNGMLIAIRVQ